METAERRWTAPPPDDEELDFHAVVAYLGLDPTNTEHTELIDGLLFEPDSPEGQPERWKVSSIRQWMLDPEFPELPGDSQALDLAGIAGYLGVAATTPQQWRQREVLLVEDPEISFPDKPAWRQRAVRNWAATSTPPRWPQGVAGRK